MNKYKYYLKRESFFIATAFLILFLSTLQWTQNNSAIRAQQTEYYISTDGTDPSDCSGGTKENPWKTWKKAAACIEPGSSVYFEPGTYQYIFSGSNYSDIIFDGISENEIRILPAPGAEGNVSFRGRFNIKGSYGKISGIEMYTTSRYSVLSVSEAEYITFEKNIIHGSRYYDCVHLFRDGNNISIVNNEIYDCGQDPDNTTDQGDAVDNTGSNFVLYQNNLIHDAVSGFQIKGGAHDITVEKNTFHSLEKSSVWGASMGSQGDPDPEWGSMEMHDPSVAIEDRYQAKDLIIKNNVMYNNNSFSIIGPRGWKNFKILNNTIINSSGTDIVYMGYATWEFFDSTAISYCQTHNCSSCTSYSGTRPCKKILLHGKSTNGEYNEIKNNIIYQFGSRILEVENGEEEGLKISHNLYYSSNFQESTSGKFKYLGSRYSLAQFQDLGFENLSIVGDPQFQNITNLPPNIHLAESSPAIDAGYTTDEVVDDFENDLRPQNFLYDIGADEYINESNCIVSDKNWQNISADTIQDRYLVEFEAMPLDNFMDGLTALSASTGSTASDYAVLVRFNPNGYIDACNDMCDSGTYQAIAEIPYNANTPYHFKIIIDPSIHRFSAYVSESDNLDVSTIGEYYLFRSQQSSISVLNTFGIQGYVGSHQICNIQYSNLPEFKITELIAKWNTETEDEDTMDYDISKDAIVNSLDFAYAIGYGYK